MTRSPASRARLARLRALLLLAGLLLVALPAFAEEPSGLLNVTATVAGAEVWIDGEMVGATPFTGYVAVGRRQVRVVADDHDPFVRKVDVEERITTKVDARLVPGAGTVEFEAQPAGAVVSIDGKVVGPVPIRVRDVTPGPHRYTVSAEGHEAQARDFEFQKGRNLFFGLTLQSSRGLLAIASTPPGAQAFLDGAPVGQTPLTLTAVPPAEHRVRLTLDGYADAYRTVDTRDGNKGEVEATLAEGGMRVVVRTGRADGAVLAGGFALGSGRRVVLPAVERGRLDLTVVAPGYDPATLDVRVPDRGRVTVRARLAAAGSGESRLDQIPPLWGRWTFWTVTGGIAAGGAVGGAVLAVALQPPPLPEGDVVVVLP